jgi:outer membrane lipoprotein-sorting protein
MKIVALGAMMVLLLPAVALGQNSDLQKVLNQLDGSSLRFKSAQADFTADSYTAVVDSHSIQKGTIAFRRKGEKVEMMMHVRTEDGQPSEKYVLYKNGQLNYYQPALKQETILKGGSNYDRYFSLGFGGSGQALKRDWNIKYEGTEQVNGTETAKLDLTPKTPSDQFTHIIIWVDAKRGVSLKQEVFQSSGDTRTAVYSNIKMNDVPDSAFELHVASGTQVQRR